MTWEITTKLHSLLQEFHLINNRESKVMLKYNPRQQSARITSGFNHRLFYMENAGSLSGKTIFRNEYGMELGHLVQDHHNNKGSLLIDDEKYNYELDEHADGNLTIYKTDPHHPLANCMIKSADKKSSTNFTSIDTRCLILSLCWYFSLPVIKEFHAVL